MRTATSVLVLISHPRAAFTRASWTTGRMVESARRVRETTGRVRISGMRDGACRKGGVLLVSKRGC